MMHSQKDLFFYNKFNVRLFKLINALSPCANSLAPLTPIEFSLNFCYLLKNFSKRFYVKILRFIFIIIYDAFAKDLISTQNLM